MAIFVLFANYIKLLANGSKNLGKLFFLVNQFSTIDCVCLCLVGLLCTSFVISVGPVYQSVCLSECPSVCQFILLPVHMSVCLSFRYFIYLFTYLSTDSGEYLPVIPRMYVCMYVCLLACLVKHIPNVPLPFKWHTLIWIT